MRSAYIARIGLVTVMIALVLGALTPIAVAQAEIITGLPVLPLRTHEGIASWLGTDATAIVQSEVAVLLLALLALGVLAAGAEAVDRVRDRRHEEAALLQARIVDALLRDPRLTVLAVAATVRLPLWRRSPATIEIWGQVPTVELWQAVLWVAGEVTSRLWAVYRLHDRIAIVPSIEAYAA